MSWLPEVRPRVREVQARQSERSTTVAAPQGSDPENHHTPGDLRLPVRTAPGAGPSGADSGIVGSGIVGSQQRAAILSYFLAASPAAARALLQARRAVQEQVK